MSDTPPKGPGWTNAPGGPNDQPNPNSIAHKSELEQVQKLRAQLPALIKEFQSDRGRAQRFYPYILIRSILNDHGNRPINVPFWESPDIWTAPGDPSASPAVPPDHGGTLTATKPHTIYAHVWNLGRAPIAGVKVEFYWFDPTIGAFDDAHAHLIGMTRVDLGPRSSPYCHKLVKCPKAWVPQMVNADGHECLVARASAIGDNLSAADAWHPYADRHVAQRNVHVAQPNADMSKLIHALEASRIKSTRVQLLQVGEQAAVTLKIAAPKLKLDPAVKTHVLAELRPDGSLALPATVTGPAGGHAPVALATPAAHPAVTPATGVPRIVPGTVLRVPAPTTRVTTPVPGPAGGATTELAVGGANLTHLIAHATLLSPELLATIKQLPAPPRGNAQVMRIVSLQGDQIVGGYTIVVGG
jgi:hypothetical protein